jgi:hypothetical protein
VVDVFEVDLAQVSTLVSHQNHLFQEFDERVDFGVGTAVFGDEVPSENFVHRLSEDFCVLLWIIVHCKSNWVTDSGLARQMHEGVREGVLRRFEPTGINLQFRLFVSVDSRVWILAEHWLALFVQNWFSVTG